MTAEAEKVSDIDFYMSLNYYLQEVEDPKRIDALRIDATIKEIIGLVQTGGAHIKVSAARTLVSLLDRRSKLLGLDSPIKVDYQNTQLNYTIDGVDVKEITGG